MRNKFKILTLSAIILASVGISHEARAGVWTSASGGIVDNKGNFGGWH